MSEPNWDRTPWNAEPGALFGDSELERYEDVGDEDEEEDCCDHGIPYDEECEECEEDEDEKDD